MALMVMGPKRSSRPPMPHTRMAATTNRLRLSFRSTGWSIFRPLTAMKPYRAMHTPPTMQEGMELTKATKGWKKDRMMQ